MTTIKGTAESQDLEVHPDLLPGGPYLHLFHLVGIMADVLGADNLVICQTMS